jgi:hypothetical protein
MRTDGVEPPQYEAPRLQRGELTSCSASAWVRVAGRARTGADGAHNPGCFRLHHGHHEAGTTGLEPVASRLTSERSGASELRPQGRGGTRDRLPATGDRRCRLRAPEPAVAHRRSCQRVSAPPPPHRLALEACRSQLHVGALALHRPFFRHFLGPPVGGPIFDSAGGIRTHGLELMRLARTAAPLPRKVWLAGVEPALSGSRSRRGGQSPLQPVDEVPPAGLEPAASGLRARRHSRSTTGA